MKAQKPRWQISDPTKEKVVFSVPCDLKHAVTVEGFIKIILPFLNASNPENLCLEFQMVLNEAFVNTIKHVSHDHQYLIDFVFEYDSTQVTTRVIDSGKGFQVDGFYPPYPKNLIGSSHIITKTMDGQLTGMIDDSRTLSLEFRESDLEILSKGEIIKNLRPNGMGLPIITKIMDLVNFKFGEDCRNQLILVKLLS